MTEKSFVIVFPSIFSRNKIPQLISNIKNILKIQNQQFFSIKRDDDIILVETSDPVFTSSSINLLYGIEKVIIARQVKNDFKTLVSEITNLGGNLLLKGDKFLVRVEGKSKGFLPKDIEIAVTSSIIEKKPELGARPGTENNYNKIIFTYITKNNAYIAIFIDEGLGGIPYGVQEQNAICCIYDDLSALSCLETIKQGFSTKILVCYRQKSDLINIVKIINKILPRLVQKKIELNFFKIPSKKLDYLSIVNYATEILVKESKKEKIDHISIAISPLIFSGRIIDYFLNKIIQNSKLSITPIYGSDTRIFENLKEIGLEKRIKDLERLVSQKFKSVPDVSKKDIDCCIKSKRSVLVTIGPNNVHDILDSLE